MKRGKLDRAREGCVIGTHTSPYGFAFNENRDSFVVDENMTVVRRIFRMVAEGHTLHGTKKVLDSEGVPTPGRSNESIPGKCSYWQMSFIRRLITKDCYRPHTHEEVRGMVDEGILPRKVYMSLDPDRKYGIWYYNTTKSVPVERVLRVKDDGTEDYKTKYETKKLPRPDWVAVPVPDSGVPRELVDAARESIQDNRRPQNTNRRVWEVSGGMSVCGYCKRSLSINSVDKENVNGRYTYHYYRCPTNNDHGAGSCEGGNWGAEYVGGLLWEFVYGLLTRSEIVMRAIDAKIRYEESLSKADLGEDYEFWHAQLEKARRKRDRYVEKMYAEGVIETRSERDEKIAACDETISNARMEMEKIGGLRREVERLKQDKVQLADSTAPRALEASTSRPRTPSTGGASQAK